MKIAVMGAGSLGIIIGGLLVEHGHDVVLIAASPASVNALRERGAIITGTMERTIPVRACLPQEMDGIYDLVLLTTKLSANTVALPQLLPHLNAQSTVCTLQNGMPEESVDAAIGGNRTIGGVVVFGATRLEPGVSKLTTPPETLWQHAYDLGEIDGVLTPRLEAARDVLKDAGGCAVVTDLLGLRWAKLLINAGVGGVCAGLGCTCGRMLDTPEAVGTVLRIADETIRTAQACGRRLTPIGPMDLENMGSLSGRTWEDRAAFLEKHFRPHGPTKPSLLQDLEQGRKTEIDDLNGYVSRKGREVGVPTPACDLIVKLVKEAEARKGVPDFAAGVAAMSAILS